MTLKFKQKNKFNKNSQAGFTIMETLVAIFILLISITGPMSFAQNGLRSAFLSRDQITAFFLAQDAIEYIKNIRDGNVVDIIQDGSTGDWLQSLEDCINSPGNDDGCTIDTSFSDEGQVRQCTSSTPGCSEDEVEDTDDYTPLNYENGVFITDSGEPSLFSRRIDIEEIEENREAQVTVTIYWKSNESVGIRKIVVRENIFNWADALVPDAED